MRRPVLLSLIATSLVFMGFIAAGGDQSQPLQMTKVDVESLSSASSLAPLFEVDLTQNLSCELPFGESPERIILGELVSCEEQDLSCSLRIVKSENYRAKQFFDHVAECRYHHSQYECRWKRGQATLSLNLGEMQELGQGTGQLFYVLKGSFKARFTAKRLPVFCRVKKSQEKSQEKFVENE